MSNQSPPPPFPHFNPNLRLPSDSSSNGERSRQIDRLLRRIEKRPDSSTVIDLFTNLRHWLHEHGYDPLQDFDEAARDSREHFLIECGAEPDRFFTKPHHD